MAASAASEEQIGVILTTKQTDYIIPSNTFFVPAAWNRFQLSELINSVLKSGPTPIPFDFLLHPPSSVQEGATPTLLRSSLSAFCEQNGIAASETKLEIEYWPSVLPPRLEKEKKTQDWVSDIVLVQSSTDAGPSVLFSGYDTFVTSYPTLALSSPSLHFSSCPIASTSKTTLPTLSVTPLQLASGTAGKHYVASGGMDRIARVWEYEHLPGVDDMTDASVPPAPKCVFTLAHHTDSISSIRSCAPSTSALPGPQLLTASWDGEVAFWDLTATGTDEAEGTTTGEPKKKKRKTEQVNLGPSSVIKAHKGKIARAVFEREGNAKAVSAGWDHAVRRWDVEMGVEDGEKSSDKVHLCLTQLASTPLYATGTMTRQIPVFDFRTSSASLAQNVSLMLTGHSSPVSAVAGHPTNASMLASGAMDGRVRIWDLRSPRQALFEMKMPPREGTQREGRNKVMALDWDGKTVVAGGEGRKLAVWTTEVDKQS